MIGQCIDRGEPFGVVMIQQGVEAYGTAAPHRIGCVAQIAQVEHLQDGRMNIAAVGGPRFEIISTDQTQPYLQGMVRELPMMQDSTQEQMTTMTTLLRPKIIQYTDVLRGIIDIQVRTEDMPDDPIAMGYFAAWILQVPVEQKQNWLILDGATKFLHKLCEAYQMEILLVREMIRHARENPEPQSKLFSLN